VIAAPGLVTLGETMGLLTAASVGPLRHARHLDLGIGGAESNVAIGVARLGCPAVWIGRVGTEPIGDLIVATLAGEQVDTSHVVRDPDVPTSLMIKERVTTQVSRVLYYRRGGPGARLEPTDLPEKVIASAGILHLTGITPALSPTAERTVMAATEIARGAGVPVSLDVNYRAALWSPAEAQRTLLRLVKHADILFAGDDEAELLHAHGTPEQQGSTLAELGPHTVVIKLGARGAVARIHGRTITVPAHRVDAVDAVGAGDAFVAGYLSEHLQGADGETALQTATACGAFVVQIPGDWEGMPSRRDLAHLDATAGTVLR
jgi:2-dehydro-3-deoxygluconokinase